MSDTDYMAMSDEDILKLRDAGLTVSAPLVSMTTYTPQGRRLVHLYQGAPVPKDASVDQVRYHLRDGLVELTAGPLPAAEAVAEDSAGEVTAEDVKNDKPAAEKSSGPSRSATASKTAGR